jgi:hypothetical protein
MTVPPGPGTWRFPVSPFGRQTPTASVGLESTRKTKPAFPGDRGGDGEHMEISARGG